ncbi:alpha/beta fold hydrolase [Amnibacterium sp.]|uniref:alpha/beta fold hydrolase n=1 Tax=Amnibacterium sp. TaxID=1872496 RepID=UPI0026327125|nr:alpha/beta fold hydrolase [Amnibacterium sp.]MCU1474030.1 alpha/beta hydrolase [Amnibacterium sp.]
MRKPVDGVVEVDGGALAVAVWPAEPSAPVVLAVHGITASSRSFLALARELPGMRIVAPDLRGRARSNGLPGSGLEQHATDLRRLLEVVGADRVTLVGHSMGAFVATLVAAAEPERVASLVLVDGGFPLAAPPGVDTSDPRPMLGPVFDRLSRVFPSRDAYREHWRRAPAFARERDWTDEVEAYVQYDLDPADTGFRSSANADAVAVDQAQLYGSAFHLEALRSLQQPVTFVRAPRGLQDEPPGLYAPERLPELLELVPQLEVVEVPDVNHYTVLMTDPGAGRVADVVRACTRP